MDFHLTVILHKLFRRRSRLLGELIEKGSDGEEVNELETCYQWEA